MTGALDVRSNRLPLVVFHHLTLMSSSLVVYWDCGLKADDRKVWRCRVKVTFQGDV